MSELWDFLKLWHMFGEVLQALGPLVVFFTLFQIFYLKLPWGFVFNLIKGAALTFVGLVLFLQGVKVGFMPAGMEMGEILGVLPNRWILVPIGFALGFVATIAEPAVRILCSEVERASTGFIGEKLILYTISIGVGIFVALAMVRIIFGIPIHYLIIPGYLLALIMMKFSNPTFISIAFDAGGVATGPIVVTLVVSITLGLASVIEDRNPIVDGFGLIAMVAMAPILTVMALGLFYSNRSLSENSDPDAKA